MHFSEEFRHASIISDSSLSKMSPCSEVGKPCNPCLDAAKACNLNETCKRLRSNYNTICRKATPPQSSAANQEPCSRKRCQKALRQFFERVSWELSYPLLFCSCPDQACAERRRRTIVPSCSHQERHKPNCLELRRTCRSDALCRSRLADFHMNCQMTSHTITTCPHDNYNGCLMSYVGLIGSDVTPNYSDSSPFNISISLWCSCRGAGPQEQECEAFHRDFTLNTCLKNAILSFGYGSEGGMPVTEPPSIFPLPAQPPIMSKPAPSLHGNGIKPMDSACMFSTCANLQDGGHKCIPSDDFECEETLLAQGSIDSQDSVGPKSSGGRSAPLLHRIGAMVCASALLHYFL
ncbi:GDNF family receptor alpha-2-like [Cololabis saira]|uniref:GDNF family receptor alpha-2-like n=1 Tax=Cololabis saira TaxID=129043 RepID=UPI002AD47CCA|nr:GDNF family receptor alpha-2-like [Cololabis saira]